jgi:hypothetical protein
MNVHPWLDDMLISFYGLEYDRNRQIIIQSKPVEQINEIEENIEI